MVLAITLSELAWIFKRELAIMISLCCFSFGFYFSQKKKKIFFFWFINKVQLGFLPGSPMSNPSLCHTCIYPGKERYRDSQKWKAMSIKSLPSNSTDLINVFYPERGIRSEPGSASRGAERASLPCYSVVSLLLQSSPHGDPMGRQGVMISQLGGSSLPKDICLLQTNQLCREAENYGTSDNQQALKYGWLLLNRQSSQCITFLKIW